MHCQLELVFSQEINICTVLWAGKNELLDGLASGSTLRQVGQAH